MPCFVFRYGLIKCFALPVPKITAIFRALMMKHVSYLSFRESHFFLPCSMRNEMGCRPSIFTSRSPSGLKMWFAELGSSLSEFNSGLLFSWMVPEIGCVRVSRCCHSSRIRQDMTMTRKRRAVAEAIRHRPTPAFYPQQVCHHSSATVTVTRGHIWIVRGQCPI